MADPRCVRCADRVVWVTWSGNLGLALFKIAVGVLGGSSALVAEGFHSFTDVIGSSVSILSRRTATRPADDCHPYGHGKVEFLGSTFVYLMLLVLAVCIFASAVRLIWLGANHPPRMVTALAALVSVVGNGVMYMLGECAGNRCHSPVLLADSFENRADAISSAGALVGILAAVWIHPIFDPLAAMAVAVMIVLNCIEQLKKCFAGLMDQALPPEVVERIRQLVSVQEGVCGIDYIRTRPTGSRLWVDVGIRVPARVNVVESQAIAGAVRSALLTRSERLHNVEVYVAPEGIHG